MLTLDDGRSATAIEVVAEPELAAWRAAQDGATGAWLAATGFGAAANEFVMLPDATGGLDRVVAGIGARPTLASLGALAAKLPAADYRLANAGDQAPTLALGWALGGYRFDAYKSERRTMPRLLVGQAALLDEWQALALCRDLINTPAAAMLPHDLETAARAVAVRHGATVEATTGDALLRRGFDAVHAVGRASASAPRLIDLRWGASDGPKVTLVGKGVCFDSGGLDLKPAAGMQLMKKDMAGAASAIALAAMVMRLGLPVRLRLLVPAVDNAVAGNAYRPLDVVATRQGTAIEIGNTDAEGRVILADALAEASSHKPDLLLDLATLTGAARVALGPELPALFCNDEALAGEIEAAGRRMEDELWRLPLWPGYRRLLESDVAPLSTTGREGTAGAIVAALFLERFVGEGIAWAHIDLMGWNPHARPGRPKGGEAMAARGLLAMLERRYGAAPAAGGRREGAV